MPYIDPSLIPQATSLPSFNGGKLGTVGGLQPVKKNNGFGSPSSLANPTSLDNIGLGFMTGGGSMLPQLVNQLFGIGGSGTPAFKPYTNPQGQVVWGPPDKVNPVPQATVPGARISPSGTYQKTANSVQSISDLLPYLNQAVNQGAVPTAIAQFNASQATSPAYAQLMSELFNQYGPVMNQIGNQIQRENQMYQADTNNQILQGPGKQTVDLANQLQQQTDPQYYQGRQATLDNLMKYFNSIDLSGQLSNTENQQIQKGLALQGAQRGTGFSPSASDTVSNAMRFGQAGFQRQQTAKSNLSDALTRASVFLPTAKSGVDAFQTATGRTSMNNPGQSLFPGVNQSQSNQAFGLAGNLLGGMNQLDTTQMGIDANKKDWLDQFNQMTSGLGNLAGAAGKVGGMFGLGK